MSKYLTSFLYCLGGLFIGWCVASLMTNDWTLPLPVVALFVLIAAIMAVVALPTKRWTKRRH